MKYKWLNQKNNKRVIVFFNGWGMDECVVNHLSAEKFDMIMFYDYTSLDADLSILNSYEKRYLVAWSMGVMVASLFDIDYISKTAINGTLKPIDNEFGIPTKIYDLTIKHLNIETFVKNMFNTSVDITPNRNFENQKEELIALKNYAGNSDFKYDKVLISDNDKIIPTKNQVKFWNIEPNLNSGHCPFFEFKKWSELL